MERFGTRKQLKSLSKNIGSLAWDSRLGVLGATMGIESVLDFAIITAEDARDPEMVKKLDAVAGQNQMVWPGDRNHFRLVLPQVSFP